MRRFIEIHPRPLDPNTHTLPEWDTVIAPFKWQLLWQALDETGPDPMLPFADELRAKQEELRGRSHVESWIEQYVFEPRMLKINPSKEYVASSHVEYWGQDLFRQFADYERTYHPGLKAYTGVTKWGTTFKNLIASGKAPGWSVHKHSHRVGYRLELSNVVPIHEPGTVTVASFQQRA